MIIGYLWINFKATLFRLTEWVCVIFKYYRKLSFFAVDILLCLLYLFRNPHRISKAFMIERGEKDVYTYGETPVTTLERIVCECGVLSHDVVYELGVGSGRTIFWLNSFVHCKAVGVDLLPTFIERANKIKRWLRVEGVSFIEEDMLQTDLSDASVIYLYGTCLADPFIEKLTDRFKILKRGAKVISVSYPLTDYCGDFKLEKSFLARYPWGVAEVFLNIRL